MCTYTGTHTHLLSAFQGFCCYNCVRCILPFRLLLHSDLRLCCFIAPLNTNNKEHYIVDIGFDIIKKSCVCVFVYMNVCTHMRVRMAF